MSVFEERLRRDAREIESAADEALQPRADDPAERLTDAMRYSLLGGGKRLRGFLTMEFCELCGADRGKALPYALAAEMVHAFSLIHDDLPCMDDDDLRRGKPACHVQFGEASALLAGDALAIRAFGLAAGSPSCSARQNAKAVSVLAKGAGEWGMCAGQQMDLESEGRVLSADDLELLVSRKTGGLFRAACELGCIAADADEKERAASILFAEKIGPAFQIADDLLDLHSTAEQLGKTPGKDVKSGKNTFPALLGEENARKWARSLCGEARETLGKYPDSEAKEALLGFCDFVTERTH